MNKYILYNSCTNLMCKVENILKGSQDSIRQPSSLLTRPNNVLPLYLKQTFPPIIWIFTEGEGDWMESWLSFKIFSTLCARCTSYLDVITALTCSLWNLWSIFLFTTTIWKRYSNILLNKGYKNARIIANKFNKVQISHMVSTFCSSNKVLRG